jgi:hypothetical protein
MGEGYSQGARPNLTSTSYAPYFRNAPTLHKTHNNKKLHNVSHTEQQFAKSRTNELRDGFADQELCNFMSTLNLNPKNCQINLREERRNG